MLEQLNYTNSQFGLSNRGSSCIEIPLLIVKSSFDSRQRHYKCGICKEVIDRLFKYEDHWFRHMIGGGGGGRLDNNGGTNGHQIAEDSSTNGNDNHAPFVRNSNQNMQNIQSPAQNKSGYNRDSDTPINTSMDHSKDGNEIKVSGEEIVPATTSATILASNGGSYQSQHQMQTLPGNSGVQSKATVESDVDRRQVGRVTNRQQNENPEISNASSINLSTIDLRGLTKFVDVQETVLEESIGTEVEDTAEGDDTDYEELIGEEEVTEDDQGEDFVLENSDGSSDSENSDDEQVKKLIEVASNLQELVKETLSENRSIDSDQTTAKRFIDTGRTTCEICSQTFTHPKYLECHMKTHTEGREWVRCNDCTRKFADVAHMKSHAKRVHKRNLPLTPAERSCPTCGKLFKDLRSLISHKYRCPNNENPVIPKRKHEAKDDSPSLKRFKKSLGPLSCDICSRTCLSKEMLSRHIKQDHKDKVAGVCRKCNKVFLNSHLLSKHQVAHEISESKGELWDAEKEERTCPSCRIEFQSIEELNRHACKVKPRQCSSCRLTLRRPEGLREHIRRHLFAESKFTCATCGWQTERNNMYIKHMAGHSNHPKPYKCDKCPHRMSNFITYKNHLRCHDKRFEFVCYVCGEVIANPTNVLGHMRSKHNIENFEKPFACDRCNQKCITLGGLEEHEKMHKNKEFVQCPQCPEKFPNKRKLRIHRTQMHFGRICKCDQCGREFATQRELKIHADKHEKKEMQCDVCNGLFVNPTKLYRHWYQHKNKICRCGRCFNDMSKASFEVHNDKHLQVDTRVNKHCRFCGQMLETVEDVYRHCMEHHEMNEALAMGMSCENVVEDAFSCDFIPWNRHCPICNDAFEVEADLTNHIETHEFGRECPMKCLSCSGVFYAKGRFMEHLNNCVNRKRKVAVGESEIVETEVRQDEQFTVSMVVPTVRNVKYNLRSVDTEQSRQQQQGKEEEYEQQTGQQTQEQSTINGAAEAAQQDERADAKTRPARKRTPTKVKKGGVVVEDVVNSNESAYPKEHLVERPIMCVLCCHFFESADGLLYHLLTACEEINQLKCWRCYCDFIAEEELRAHLKRQKDHCPVVDSTSLELRSTLFSCEQCHKYFVSENLRALHHAQCHDVGTYQCHKCPQEFTYRCDLEKHVFEQHALEEGSTNICVVCCESFDGLYELQQHVYLHKLMIKEF